MTTSMRDAFFLSLEPALRQDPGILILSNDQGAPSLDAIRAELPRQFLNMAISEQNLISVAAGLAKAGKKVFVYGIAPFVTLRCFEQIKIDLCAMRLPVVIVGVGSGYSYATDGPTHHATEDVSVMRALANMQIFCPSDPRCVPALVQSALLCQGPLYIRLDREAIALPIHPWVKGSEHGFSVLREGSDLSLCACGNLVHRALELAEVLGEHGVSVQVIDCYQLKPIPGQRLKRRLAGIPRVATLEEHTLHGGLGSAILETLADLGLALPVKRFGITDPQLYAYGVRNDLHWQRGLDLATLCHATLRWLRGEEEVEAEPEAEPETEGTEAPRAEPAAPARPPRSHARSPRPRAIAEGAMPS